MTYPDQEANRLGLTSVGSFTNASREGDAFRERLAAIGMSWFNTCQNERVQQERQWYLNYAFFSGNQYVQFRQAAQNGPFDLYTPKAPYYRVRLVVNQIRKIVRKEIARLTAQKPNAFVVPSSSEDQDVFAAQAGEQIWSSLWRRLHFNRTLKEAVFWQTVCGNGFIKTYWDPTKIDLDSGKQGDICIENVTPFHLFVPDLMATSIEDQPYIIHAQVRSNSWVLQNLGIDASNHALDSVDSSLQQVMGVQRNTSKKDQTVILEIWVKPNYILELPNGGMFTIAANQVVQGFDQWPYEHPEYPVAKLDGVETGKFYNSSIIEDLIPLQKELNRSRSQLIESKNRMSKPQLLAQKGSVDAKKITTEPGQLIEYNPGFEPPTPLAMQNLPSYVTDEINRLYEDIADISGQHEVSNGSTPPGVTAATAISFLQEQDESIIASHYDSVESCVEKVAAQCLSYVKMYWDEARTVKVVGLEGGFDVVTFKNSDIRGNTDIRVEAGSSLPTSRAAKQAFIMDLMKMGFITPEEGLELLEVGGLNRIYERVQVDKRQAQRENLKMRVVTPEDMEAHIQEWQSQVNPEAQKDVDDALNLEPPLIVSVNTWDNHQVHIEEHNKYRKSQAFESADAHTRALFEEHVRMHQEALAGVMPHPLDDGTGTVKEPEPGPGGNTGPDPMPEMDGDFPEQNEMGGEIVA